MEYGTAKGATTEFYAVPSGKTLMLTSVNLACANQAAAYQEGKLYIRDDGDNVEMQWWIGLPDTGFGEISIPFPDPLEVSEGWDFAAVSSDADLSTVCAITGYLV